LSLTLSQATMKVNKVFSGYGGASTTLGPLVPAGWLEGKVYEAWVLTVLLESLRLIEQFQVTLIGGSNVHLKSSGGPINANYPRFLLTRPGAAPFEVWTDVEFSTMSFDMAHAQGLAGSSPGKPHKHELDIVVVPAGTCGYPAHNDIVIGIECKNTAFHKSMARAALGVRRELSLLAPDRPTQFASWPRSEVPAEPPSVLLVFSTDPAVADYNDAGAFYGVDFRYEPMT
jgi:hypothetical protein